MSANPLGIPAQTSPYESEVTIDIEVNDSEIPKIEEVLRIINSRQGRLTNLEDFRKEILERFGALGFKVDVRVYEAETYGNETIYCFKILVNERLDGAFDPNQQVQEVTRDILGLGTEGVISTSKLWTPPSGHKH